MSILSEQFDLTPQDIIKNAVVKLLTKYDDDPNSVKIIWESCDWPRIVKRPDKNVITYYYQFDELHIHIRETNKHTKKYVISDIEHMLINLMAYRLQSNIC